MPSKPRERRNHELVHFDVRLTDWRWEYGFAVAAPLGRESPRKPYFDNRQIELYGVPIRPHGLRADAALFRLLFLVDMKEVEGSSPPPSIGDLNLYDGLLKAFVVLPIDVLSSVLVMLTANKFKRVSIWAPKLHYGKSQIAAFHFCRNIDDEYPE
ncbi:hypothetical protein N7I30_16460 [Aurantimonas litoralis]|nr:hypothetical protein [Aurantimonas litoralis]